MMKRLLFTLCVSVGLTSFAQVAHVTAPPYYSFEGDEMVVKSKSVATHYGEDKLTGATRSITRPGNRVSDRERTLARENPRRTAMPGMKLSGVKRVDSDKAVITLDVKSDWGMGDGFEIWLDKDCTIENDLYRNGVAPETVFEDVDIVIPTGANLEEGFLTGGESVSVEIEPGDYDFLVMNPSPEEGTIYMVLETTDSHGDDVTFVGGYEYNFAVAVVSDFYEHDECWITADADVDLRVTAAPLPHSGALGEDEQVSMTIRNIGGVPCTQFIASYTVNGGTPVVEPVDETIPVGGTLTYTFNTPVDLSEEGDYTIRVKVQGVGEALVMSDNWFDKPVSCLAGALQSPYSCNFLEESDRAEWNFIDNDDDKATWQIETYQNAESGTGRAYSYNCFDDYMVMASPIALKAGENTIEIMYRSLMVTDEDKFEVLYGTTPEVSEMTLLKTYTAFANGGAWTNDAISINLDQDGEYYVAFHACPEHTSDNEYFVCSDIGSVKIYSGSNQGAPDLRMDNVVVPNSSCGIKDFDIEVEVSNIGSAPITGFNLTASYIGNEFSSKHFDVEIPINGTATVTFPVEEGDLEMTAGTLYSITMTATAVMSDNEVEEENLENNSGWGGFINFEEAEVPFVSEFSDPEAGRYYWFGPSGWTYDDDFYVAYHAVSEAPLISRGVNLEAGKTYRITYNRMAGRDLYGIYTETDNYKILCGLNGTDVSTWDEIRHVTGDYTVEIFDETSYDFTVPSDGLYQFAFQMDYINQVFSFYLRSVSITEVVEKDVAIGSSAMPTRVPKTQTGEFEAMVPLTNVGSAPVSGTITVTDGDKLIGTAEFGELAVGATENFPVYFTIDGEVGVKSITIAAEVEGEPEVALYNNSENVEVLITENEMAYDKIADGTYYGNQPYNLEVGSVGSGSECEVGIIFHLNNDAKLTTVSVGWATETEMTGVGLNVYRWTNPEPDVNGYYPFEDDALIYNATVDKEYGIGQIEYAVDEDVILPAGDYFISVYVPSGWPLAVDRRDPGQLYTIGEWGTPSGLVAFDQAGNGLGTMALRARLVDPVSSVESAVAGDGVLSIYPNPVSETLNITCGGEEIESVAIYSTSGAEMYAASVGSETFTCDVSGYMPGVYLASIVTKSGTKVEKFVVK